MICQMVFLEGLDLAIPDKNKIIIKGQKFQ